MRKVWKSTLAVVLAVSMLATTAQAQNGPRGWYEMTYETEQGPKTERVYGGYIAFYEYEETGSAKWTADGEEWVMHEVFSEGKVKNELSGASYDLETNTLTLKDVNQPFMCLSISQMGDDFKLKVEGECTLGEIDIYTGGYYLDREQGYATSMTIEGTGTLNLTTADKIADRDKKYSYLGMDAIECFAGGMDCRINIGKDVTLNISAGENAIDIYSTAAAVPVRYENGQKADVTVEENVEARLVTVNGYVYEKEEEGHTYYFGNKYKKASDPEGIYAASEYTDYKDAVMYDVVKYLYLEEYGAYIPDWSFGENGRKTYTEAQMKEEGFEAVVSRQVDNPKWVGNQECVEMIGCEILVDDEGHKYGVHNTGVLFDGYETTVFDMEPLENSKGQYLLTVNPDVNRDSLKSTNQRNVYGYYYYPNGYVDSYRDTICKSDPDGIYWSQHITSRDMDDNLLFEGNEVYKMIYLEDRDLYIFDPEYNGNPNGSYTPKRFTDEEFDADFELVCDLGPEELQAGASFGNYLDAELYQDQNGKQYAVRDYYTSSENENGEWVENLEKRVYSMVENSRIGNAEQKAYIFVPAKDVKFEDLTRVLKPLEGTAIYNVTSDKKLTYVGGTKATVTTEKIADTQPATEKPTEQKPADGEKKTTEQPTTQAGQATQQPTTQAGQKTQQPTTQAGQKTTEQQAVSTQAQREQPMKVTVKKPTVKFSKLKKKKQTVAALTVKNAEGTVKYEKVKKGSASQLTVNTKTGKVTVKKGTKKGTYKIKIKVTAAGNDGYLSGYKIVTVKIKVK